MLLDPDTQTFTRISINLVLLQSFNNNINRKAIWGFPAFMKFFYQVHSLFIVYSLNINPCVYVLKIFNFVFFCFSTYFMVLIFLKFYLHGIFNLTFSKVFLYDFFVFCIKCILISILYVWYFLPYCLVSPEFVLVNDAGLDWILFSAVKIVNDVEFLTCLGEEYKDDHNGFFSNL